MSAQPSYRAQMGEAFEVLAEGLAPFVDRRMAATFPGDEWILVAADKLGKRADFLVSLSDPQFQLDVLNRFWGPVFAKDLDPGLRSAIGELRAARNAWAHIDDDNPIDLDYALRVNALVEELLAGGRTKMFVGGDQIQISMGLPASVSLVLQGAMLFFVLGGGFFTQYRLRWTSSQPAVSSQ